MNYIKNFILIILSILITLILIEFMLRFFLPQEISGSWRIQDKNGLWINKSNSSSFHEFIYNKKKISVNYYFGQYSPHFIGFRMVSLLEFSRPLPLHI